MGDPLRLGFVVDGTTIPAWHVELVEAVRAEPGLEASRILIRGELPHERRLRPLRAACDALDRLLDRGRNRRAERVPLAATGVERVACASDGDAADDRGRTPHAAAGLDLVLDLTGRDPAENLAAATRLGLWRIRFGVGARSGPALPELHEVVEQPSYVTVTLESVAPDGARTAIGRATCGAHPYSLRRTRSVAAAAAVNLTLGRLRALGELGAVRLARGADEAERGAPPLVGAPRVSSTAGAFATCLARVARRFWLKAVRDEFYWSVAVAPRTPGSSLEAMIRDAAFRELPQPADCFHADPFVFEHDGGAWLFVEAFPESTGRGVIAASRIESDGSILRPTPVLERPYHLSYPFVFEHGGEILMVPETSANRTIELYRCERFPDRWALDAVLFDGVEAADATLLEHEGRWWMFATLASRGLWLDTELHLFHAPDVRGPWRPHPLNPVVSDVRCARPAGPIWRDGDRLVRPAQDCSPGHAVAIAFQEITVLTPETYAERPLTRLAAGGVRWKRRAERTHHWFVGEHFVSTDATVSRFRMPRRLAARRGAGTAVSSAGAVAPHDAQGSG